MQDHGAIILRASVRALNCLDSCTFSIYLFNCKRTKPSSFALLNLSMVSFTWVSLALLAAANAAKLTQRNLQAQSFCNPKHARQVPTNATGVKSITTPQGITIRYNELGLEGLCETTPGVNNYSGYIDLDICSHENAIDR
jgi:hypothetical protein